MKLYFAQINNLIIWYQPWCWGAGHMEIDTNTIRLFK